jgi:hypothetical protein|tara:strand:- start:490 stop:684 length:195 start_codon:yes stop_codon:yes gene_type:complete
MYKITMVKDGLFRLKKRLGLKNKGSHFLVQLDSDVADFYRQRAKKVGKDANKYLSELLTKGTNE